MSKSNKIIAGLGVAAMPFAGTFADTASHDVEVQYSIDEFIELTIDGDDDDKVFDPVDITTSKYNDGTNYHSLDVSTNAEKGYNITVTDAASTKTGKLLNGNGGEIASFDEDTAVTGDAVGWGLAAQIPADASAGVFPGYATSGDQEYLGVETATKTVVTHSSISSAIEESTNIKYGVRAAESQPSGTYSATLTYTATTNS